MSDERGRIAVRDAEIRMYREMLYHMTSLGDWQQAGYNAELYQEIVAEFEPRIGDNRELP